MLTLQPATSASDVVILRTLFHEYGEALGVDLSFQGFEEEVRGLPGDYAPPRGTLILAQDRATPLGCVAVRPLETEIAEMKRLYVRPAARNLGLGRELAEAAINFAREAGYRAIRLDTLPQMTKAQALYQTLGFHPIPAYRHNPVPGTAYLELVLAPAKGS